MANIPDYGCTRCGKPVGKSELTVKKALFTEMGEGAKTVRSRVTDWLCDSCLESDLDYQRERFSAPRFESELHVS